MNSGIYEYVFANGDNYIGQAVDITKRWDQHIAKMEKGTHTKLIQAAYNLQGLPRFRVILECHPHYLDAFESLYIYNLKPSLNGNQPAHYLTRSLDINVSQDIITRNIYDNIIELQAYRVSEQISEEQIEQLEVEIDLLHKRVLEVAKEKAPEELQKYIQGLETDADFLATQVRVKTSSLDRTYKELVAIKERVNRHNQLPWYKRLFHTV